MCRNLNFIVSFEEFFKCRFLEYFYHTIFNQLYHPVSSLHLTIVDKAHGLVQNSDLLEHDIRDNDDDDDDDDDDLASGSFFLEF